MSGTVSVVVPTRNRSQLAYKRAQWALAQADVGEVIFVVDGTEDDTEARLLSLARQDSRLKLVVSKRNVGPPKAKNMGVRAATCEWVFIIDDDDLASPNLIEELLRVAHKAGAGVVGVPWFNIAPGLDVDAVIAAAPRVPGGPKLDQPGLFPDTEWAECLWMHANTLFHRSVFDTVAYDESYAGSYYREENDVFVSAARAGHKVVVAATGYTYMRSRAAGGINRQARLRYELSVMRNSMRFLRKHGAWLREQGLISSAVGEQMALAGHRMRPLARAAARKAMRAVRISK